MEVCQDVIGEKGQTLVRFRRYSQNVGATAAYFDVEHEYLMI